MTAPLRIDIVSDVMCPWCIIGYRQLAIALEQTGTVHEIHWHPFELNPQMPPEGQDGIEHVAEKYGSTRSQSEDSRARMTAPRWPATQAQDVVNEHATPATALTVVVGLRACGAGRASITWHNNTDDMTSASAGGHARAMCVARSLALCPSRRCAAAQLPPRAAVATSVVPRAIVCVCGHT